MAAIHCGEHSTAAKACCRAVQLSGGKHVNTDVLQLLVEELERRRGVGGPCNAAAEEHAGDAQPAGTHAQQAPGEGQAPAGNVPPGAEAQADEAQADEAQGDEAQADEAQADEEMGEQAARMLDAFEAMGLWEASAEAGGAPAAAGEAGGDVDAEQARLRQRGMLVRPLLASETVLCSLQALV